LRDQVARRCQARGWSGWVDTVTDWLLACLQARLPLPHAPPAEHAAAPVALADLRTCLPEMEFWLAAQPLSARDIDRLVTAHTLGGAPRPPLRDDRLHGMFKGFMDLV
ncbi:hypothetical protein, partial [Aquabacterium sp. A08]|uniref:hypothetical protein n=1 Tax=Aquabacterium sp. A08 TaxID=2718532 RepID=UPI001AAF3F39